MKRTSHGGPPPATPADRVRVERRAQGLPARLEDREIAARLARILATPGTHTATSDAA